MTAVGQGRFVRKKQNYNFRITTAEDARGSGFYYGGQVISVCAILAARKQTWELVRGQLTLRLIGAIEEHCLDFDASGNRTTKVKGSIYSTIRRQLIEVLPSKFGLVKFEQAGMLTMIVLHAQEVVHLNNRIEDIREALALALGYHLTNFVWSYSIEGFMSSMERISYIKQVMRELGAEGLLQESAYDKIFNDCNLFQINAGIKALLPTSGSAMNLPLDSSTEKNRIFTRHTERTEVMWLNDFAEHGDIRCNLPGKLPELREFAQNSDVLAKLINHYVSNGYFVEIEEGTTL